MRFDASMITGYTGNSRNKNNRRERNERNNNEQQYTSRDNRQPKKLSWDNSLLSKVSRGEDNSSRNDNTRRFNLTRKNDDESGYNTEVDERKESSLKKQIEELEECLRDFTYDYANALKPENGNGRKIRDIICNQFWKVAKIMYDYYYHREYSSLKVEMERVIDIVSTERFANCLRAIFVDNVTPDNWSDGAYEHVAFVLSTALETNYMRIRDEVLSLYTELIQDRGLMGVDIMNIVNKTGVTKDLVTDLIIGIPVGPRSMTDATLTAFAPKFLSKLMIGAEENINILSRTTQEKLFCAFFGEGKIATKALGKMLAAPRILNFANDARQKVYEEYIIMLADKLDSLDIAYIEFVLKYVAQQGKEQPGIEMAFSAVSKGDNANIRKALFSLVEKDTDARDILL